MTGDAHQPGDRRPIASREHKTSQLAANWLARRGVSPNAISVTGMLCGIAAGLAFAATARFPEMQRLAWIAGAILTQLRLLANMFDGMVAIASQKTSAVGELYNEVPDRISDAAIFIGVGCAAGGNLALGFAATSTAIFTAYVRAMGKVAGGRQEFCGPMAKQHRMFVITLLGLYNGLMPLDWQQLHLGPATAWGTPAIALAFIIVGSLLTALRRLLLTARILRTPKS